ncbi:MAG: hypothetical protein ACLFUJ_07120 [Phycisphaerae bacterium]
MIDRYPMETYTPTFETRQAELAVVKALLDQIDTRATGMANDDSGYAEPALAELAERLRPVAGWVEGRFQDAKDAIGA